MILSYRVLAEADEEVDRAAGYYGLRTAHGAHRFLRDYFRVRDYARENARAGRRMPQHTGREIRAFPFDDFRHTMIVAVLQDELVVVAVAHQSRKPGHWIARLKHL